MEKIRVLLGNYPMMIPGSYRQLLAEQEDIDIVGDCRGPMRILQETGRTKADVVILAHEVMDEPGLCGQLLAVYPDLTLLMVIPSMACAYTQQLCSHRWNVMSDEPHDIVQTLRMVVRKPCEEHPI